MDLSASTDPWVSFFVWDGNGITAQHLQVLVSTNNGTTWELLQPIASPGQSGSSTAFARYAVNLSQYKSATTRLAFGSINTYGSSDIWLDQVVVEERVATTNTFNPTAAADNWFTAANWSLGRVPNALDNVVIAAGKTANINVSAGIPAFAASLNVAGTLQYSTTTNYLIVGGDVTVASGGTLRLGTSGTTGLRIYVGGDLVVNGTLNGNLGTGCALYFFGRDKQLSGSGTITGNIIREIYHAGTGTFTYNQTNAVAVQATFGLFNGNVNPNSKLNLGVSTFNLTTIKGFGNLTAAPGFPNIGTSTRSVTYQGPNASTVACYSPFGNVSNISAGGPEVEVISGVKTVTGTLTFNHYGNFDLVAPLQVGNASFTGTLTMTRGIVNSTSTNYLWLGPSCAGSAGTAATNFSTSFITTATAGSYVAGPIRVAFNALAGTKNLPFGFGTNLLSNVSPFGAANGLRPMVLSRGTGNWASQDITVTPSTTASGSFTAPLAKLVSNKLWQITENTGTLDANTVVTLSVRNQSLSGGGDNLLATDSANHIRLVQSTTGTGGWTSRSNALTKAAFTDNTAVTIATQTGSPGPITPLSTNGGFFALAQTTATVGTCTATTPVSTAVSAGQSDLNFLRIAVIYSPAGGTISLSGANITGTFTDGDVADAKIWAGTVSGPTGASPLGTVSNPSPGTISFTGLTTTLAAGLNYFWVTYSMAATLNGSSAKADLMTGGLTFSTSAGAIAPTARPAADQLGTARLFAAPIVITPATSTTFCAGGSVSLAASSLDTYTYTWSPATGLSTTTGGTVIASPTTTTTYTVTGVNGPNTVTRTQVVTVNQLPTTPTILGTPSGSVCQGTNVNLSLAPLGTVLGTGTTTSGLQGPMRSNWGAGRFQYLYLASDIGGSARSITAISFNVSSFSGARPTFAGYTVRMANSAATALTSTYQTPTWTNVYFNNAQPAPTATGAYVITFSTPFAWDGTSNVIIDICHNNQDGGNGTDVSFTSTSLAYNASTSAAADNSATHCSIASGTASTTRPNTTFLSPQIFSTYVWSPSTGLSATNIANPVLTVPAAGANTYTLTGTDANGCVSASGSITVTGLAVPSAPGIEGNPSHCGNKVPGTTFTYTTGAGISLRIYATNTSTTPLETIASPGIKMATYLVSTTTNLFAAVVAANGCESARTPFTVTVTAAPAITITPVGGSTICVGQSKVVNLTSTADYTYTWSPTTGVTAGTTDGSFIVAPTATTVYTVTGVDPGLCQNSAQITITVNSLPRAPVVVATQTGSACQGSPIGLSVPSFNTALGTGTGTGSVQGPLRSNWGAGRYQYLYTAADIGGPARPITAISFDVSAFSGARPTFAGYTVKMANSPVTALTATYQAPTWTDVYFNNAQPAPTATGAYVITFSTPFMWDGTSNVIIDICHNNPDAGNGTAVTFTNTTLAYNASTSAVADNSASHCTIASGTASTIRPNTNFITTQSYSSYSWSPSTGLSAANVANPTLTVPSAGALAYTLTVTNANGCQNTSVFNVTGLAVPSAPTVAANPSHCGNKVPGVTFGSHLGDSIRIYATNSSTVVLERIAAPALNMSTYLVGTTTNLFAAVVGANGCESARTPFTVTVVAAPTITATPTTPTAICPGGSVAVTLSSTADYTYTWSSPAQVTAGTTAGTFIITPSAAGTFTATGVDPLGCENTAAVNITFLPVPSAPIISSSAGLSVCQGAATNLNVTDITTVLGTGTTSGGLQGPMRSNWGGSRHQYLYRASDIGGAARTINAISFNVVSFSGARPTFTGYTIKMASTASTALTAFETPTWTTVYTNANQPAPTATGAFTFNLSTPFAWNGTSNVLVEVCYNDQDGGNGTDVSFSNTTLAYNGTVTLAQDNNANVCTNAGTTSTTRPNTTFITRQVFSSFSWSPATGLSETNIANPVLTVPSTGPSVYTLTVTNASGCTSSNTITVTGVTPPDALSEATNVSHCGIQTPNVTINTVIGDTMFVFADAGLTTLLQKTRATAATTALAGFTMGAGTVYVVGKNPTTSCFGPSLPVTISITAAPALSASIQGAYDPCTQSTASVQLLASGTGYTTYAWTPSTGLSAANIANPVANPKGTTVYTVVASGAGCQNTTTVTVTRQLAPVATASASSYGVLSGQAVVLTGVTRSNLVPDPILGNGTAPATVVTNVTVASPYATYWGANKQQYIIRASELRAAGYAAGAINGMWFTINSIGTEPNVQDFAVFMDHTSLNDLSTTSHPATTFSTPANLVYGPTTRTLAPNSSDTVRFTNAFNWNGVDNIIVQTCFDNDVFGTSNAGTLVVPTAYVSTMMGYGDNQGGSFCSSDFAIDARQSNRPVFNFLQLPTSTTVSWTGPNGFTSTNRTLVINPTVSGTYTFRATGNGCTSTATPFNVDIVACPIPTGLASTGVTATTASFTHNLMAGITNYIVAYRLVGTTTYTSYYVSNGSFTIVGLAPSSSYEVNVRTFCNFASSSTASNNVVVTTALVNDVVAGALTLPVSNNFVPLLQDNSTATTGPEPAPTCQSNYSRDVWYKYTVPASGRVMIYANVGTLTRLNIQHFTGNAAQYTLESTWPGNVGYGPVGRPRSATLVITRNDGGLIGV